MKFLIGLLVLVSSLQSFSAEKVPAFNKGVFTLYSTPGYEPKGFCDRGSKLILDSGSLIGNVVHLSNFVAGMCTLYVFPDERVYTNLSITEDACGSKYIKGQRVTVDGLEKVEVIDHRLRICDDLVDASVIVTETTPRFESTMYSYDR